MGEMGESGRMRKQASELSAGAATAGLRHTTPARTPGEGDTRPQTPRLCLQQTQRVHFPACFFFFYTFVLDLHPLTRAVQFTGCFRQDSLNHDSYQVNLCLKGMCEILFNIMHTHIRTFRSGSILF